jgi:hypothetical protein
MRDWLATFGGVTMESAPKAQRPALAEQIEDILRPQLFRDGRWYMDYVRIRVKAEFKPDPRR